VRAPGRRPLVALALAGVVGAVLVVGALAAPPEQEVPATLDAVVRYDLDQIPTTHTDDDVDYPQDPPVGGRHDPAWLDCGAYDVQVRAENLVHDLEHGTVVISHRPDLDGDDVALLEEQLPDNGILTPWEGLDAPVVVTVWGVQLSLTGADDPRLTLFIAQFGNGETAPEPMASCAGGVPDPTGEESDSVAA